MSSASSRSRFIIFSGSVSFPPREFDLQILLIEVLEIQCFGFFISFSSEENYTFPLPGKLLEEYVAVSPDAVAQALARSYHWTIAPCGDTALNLLGLSDQVTAVWSYISDGPYKTYEWNHVKIEFRHRTNREITGLSYMTSLVIHGLKALGKERVSEETIERLSARLSEPEKTALLRESSESSDWIVDTVRKICLGGAA